MSTSTTVRRVAATLTAGAAAACLATASPANAAVPHRGTVYFIIASTDASTTAVPKVIMHGALNAYGKDDASHDNYDAVMFTGGSLRLVHPEAQEKDKFYVNPKTCFASFTSTGTFHLSRGTGSYAGIRGSGTYRGSGDFFLNRKANGTCDMEGAPRAGVYTVRAHATLT